MIMILGSNHDDILYFDTVIKNRKEEIVLNKYKIITGTLFNQAVLLVDNVYSSYASSALVTYLIEKYFVILVFVVGKCYSFDKALKNGDIVISKAVIGVDVDQVGINQCTLGQIPNYPQAFNVIPDLIRTVESVMERGTLAHSHTVTMMSSNTQYHSLEQLNNVSREGYVLGVKDNIAFDSESIGVAIATSLFDIPFIDVKVVENRIGSKQKLEDYLLVLKQYSLVGKIIVSCIGEIGSSDTIIGQRGDE